MMQALLTQPTGDAQQTKAKAKAGAEMEAASRTSRFVHVRSCRGETHTRKVPLASEKYMTVQFDKRGKLLVF